MINQTRTAEKTLSKNSRSFENKEGWIINEQVYDESVLSEIDPPKANRWNILEGQKIMWWSQVLRFY